MNPTFHRLQCQTLDMYSKYDESQKRKFEIICKRCKRRIHVKVSIESFDRQEQGGTIETFSIN